MYLFLFELLYVLAIFQNKTWRAFFLDEKHHLIVDIDCEGMKESFSGFGDWFQFPIDESVFIFQVLLPGPVLSDTPHWQR